MRKTGKILTIEETTGSHWLYVELLESVDKILICDPYRNSLLKEGAKNDKIDARKLCLLLRSGLLKEVYRGEGLKYKKDKIKKGEEILLFVEGQQKRAIKLYEEEKKKYEEVFKELKKKNEVIKMLCQVSGIKETSGVKIYSVVIEARRFENKYKYWAMCGLVKHDRESGGKNYGKKNPRYSRILKNVYKSAALAAIGGNNDIREYYEVLLQKGHPIAEAKNQIARYIAKVTYAVMKNKKPYKAYQWRELNKQKS